MHPSIHVSRCMNECHITHFLWLVILPAKPLSLLGALLITDDGIRNEDVWAKLGQSHGIMSPHHINDFSCQTSKVAKGSLRRTYMVSLLELDRCAVWRGSMWRHLTPHDALRLWHRRAVVGKVIFHDGQ